MSHGFLKLMLYFVEDVFIWLGDYMLHNVQHIQVRDTGL